MHLFCFPHFQFLGFLYTLAYNKRPPTDILQSNLNNNEEIKRTLSRISDKQASIFVQQCNIISLIVDLGGGLILCLQDIKCMGLESPLPNIPHCSISVNCMNLISFGVTAGNEKRTRKVRIWRESSPFVPIEILTYTKMRNPYACALQDSKPLQQQACVL